MVEGLLTSNGAIVFVDSCYEVRERNDKASQGDEDGTAADQTGPVDPAAKVTHKHDQQRIAHLSSAEEEGRKMLEGLRALESEREGRRKHRGGYLVEGSDQARCLAGQPKTSLNSRNGAFHIAGYHELSELQKSLAHDEELQRQPWNQKTHQNGVFFFFAGREMGSPTTLWGRRMN